MDQRNLIGHEMLSFQVAPPALAKAIGGPLAEPEERVVRIAIGKRRRADLPFTEVAALVTRERNGEILSRRELFSR